jgi:hypothetical protein
MHRHGSNVPYRSSPPFAERNLWNFLLPIFVGIWKAKPKGTTVSRLIRARCELRISCSVGISSDGVARCKHCAYGVRQLPRFHFSVRKDHPHCADLVFSLALISFLFAAIYKVLPDRDVEWGDAMPTPRQHAKRPDFGARSFAVNMKTAGLGIALGPTILVRASHQFSWSANSIPLSSALAGGTCLRSTSFAERNKIGRPTEGGRSKSWKPKPIKHAFASRSIFELSLITSEFMRSHRIPENRAASRPRSGQPTASDKHCLR